MFDSIGKAAGYAKRLIKLKDDVEFLEAVQPLQEALNDAQREATEAMSKIHELTVENIDLKTELRNQRKAASLKDDYSIHTFPTGNIAWKYNKTDNKDYSFICATCVEKGEKSPLQVSGICYDCPNCKTQIFYKDSFT